MVGDFNNLLSVIEWSSRQKISEDIVELCITISQLDLIDIYRILHPKTAEYTFFSKKIDICQYIKNSLHKKVIIKVNRYAVNLEKYSYGSLTSIIYKVLLEIHIKGTCNSTEKWMGKEYELSKE